MVSSKLIRVDKDLMKIINTIRAKYIMEGKKPPTIANITKVIARDINAEELIRNVIIKF